MFPSIGEFRYEGPFGPARRIHALSRMRLVICHNDSFLNTIQVNGTAVGENVYHYHTYIFPCTLNDGAMLNWEHTPSDMRQIEEVYNKILVVMS